MGMQGSPAYPGVQRGLLALMDEEDKPRGLLALLDESFAPIRRAGPESDAADTGSGLASWAWGLTQQAVEPYVHFYQNSIVRPFYAGLDALAQTPFGDPGFYASIQGAGPPGALIGGIGAAGASGLRALAALGRRVGFGGAATDAAVLDNPVLLDSSVVPRLPNAPNLGDRILEGETPIVSYVTRPELRNAVSSGRGLKGVPHVLDDLPILSQAPSLDARINLRGKLNPKDRGLFGDGIIGAQAIENEIPLVTDDKWLKMVVRKYGGEVR
jgi:predicted nucleic acid-binding protein